MKPVSHSNSTNSRPVKDSIKFLSLRKPRSTTEELSENCHKNMTSTAKSFDINESVNTADRRSSFSRKFSSIKTRTMELIQTEPRLSIRSSDFNTLPSRGIKKSKGPGTKSIINSDTFSQTKTLHYTDHQKSPCNSFHSKVNNANDKVYAYNSMDSLNSYNDPDVVAALDQIASRMGLIEYQVMETSDDPIKYLLKTKSFIERLSSQKSSPSSNSESRVQSLIYRTESNLMKIENKDLLEKPPVLIKKESTFRKMMEHLSPKSLRRTKSSSPTFSSSSVLDRNFNGNKISKNKTKESRGSVDIVNSNKFGILSNETNIKQRENPISNDSSRMIGDLDNNSQRLLNSIKIDRVEDPLITFHRISKHRLTNNGDQIPIDDILNNILESSCTESINLQQSPYRANLSFRQPPNPLSARYIRISLSAFGYGPDPSSHVPRGKYEMNDAQKDSLTPSASGDQYYSDEEDKPL